MRKIILLLVLVVVLSVVGGVIIYAKDSPIFDPLFPKEKQEERELNRMAKLYLETIGDYSLYSWGAEKIRKNPEECEEVNETINTQKGNVEVKGNLCGRFTIGQYRQAGTDKVVFVHLYRVTSGKELLEALFNNNGEKLGEIDIIVPERHEIAWLTSSKIDYVLTQEGTVKFEPDGGQSMSYLNRATGENPVTQYFISKFIPIARNKN